MNNIRKRRLIYITMIVGAASLVVGLMLFALRQNINLFYSPSQIANKEVPINRVIRLGGIVEKDSIKHLPHSLQTQFLVTDHVHAVEVQYNGVLPDLFREEQSVVVEGKLKADKIMLADQVLAKHDEKYIPKQVKQILKQEKL